MNHDIDATQALERRRDHAIDAVDRTQVRFDQAFNGHGARHASGGRQDRRAAFAEAPYGGLADAARAARHQYALRFEFDVTHDARRITIGFSCWRLLPVGWNPG